MNLLPKTAKQFNEADYWERFFSKQGAKAFEWYGEYHQLCSVLAKYIRTKDTILVAGCGNSTLSADMWNLGFRNLESVDISDVAVRQMNSKHADSGMVFRKMDLTSMTYDDGSFSCVLDKGTLDALFTGEDAEVVDTVERMFEEIYRVLRVGGRYICISLLQSHIIRKLLEWFGSRGWMLRVCRCREAESVSSSGITFPVYVVICTKFVLRPDSKPLNIIESCMGEAGDRPVRQPSSCALLQLVAGQQRLAFVCHSARTLGAGDGLTLELCKSCSASDSIDGAESGRRYTLHVVDRSRKKTGTPFAIFIVPHGRETEWLFGSSTGRHHLADTAGFDRLLVVHLHRDQIYGTLGDVQQELSTQVLQLKPSHLPDGVQVPFLTIGEDLGRREVRYRGTSAMSGRYLIEDVYSSDSATTADVYRRLVFLSNLNVVQSEVKLKSVGDKCGPTSWQVDANHLCCRHHRYMTLGVYSPPSPAQSPPPPARVLVVGLGGGALVKFMEHRFSQLHIDVVDIDPDVVELASAWFGFNQSDHVTVHVADGIQFVQQSADKGDRYDVILFDVDCKDSTLGMSGPPAPFLQQEFLRQVYSILVDQYGMLVLNLAARDPSLRRSAQECLSAVFDRCVTYQLAGEVNQVVYCTRVPSSLPSGQVTEVITQRLRRAAIGLNGAVEGDGQGSAGKGSKTNKRKVAVKVVTEEFVDAAEFLSGLTVL